MIRLAWRTITKTRSTVVGAFATLALTGALICGIGFLLDSGRHSHLPTERYGGVPIVVHPKDPDMRRGAIPDDLLTDLQRVQGVERLVPERTFPVSLLDDRGNPVAVPGARSLGHAWDSSVLTPFTVRTGAPLSNENEVVLDARLAERSAARPGQWVILSVNGTTGRFRVAGVASAAAGADWIYQSAVFFHPTQAVRLSGTGNHVDAVGVYPAAGSDTLVLARRLDSVIASRSLLKVSRGEDLGAAEGNLRDDASTSESAVITVAVFTVMLSAVVLTGAMGLSVRRRGQQITLLRAIGATPRQIRAMLAGEGLLMAVLAMVVAVPVGALVANGLAMFFVGIGALSPAFRLSYGIAPPLEAAGIILVVAQLVALGATRRALAHRPEDVIGEVQTEGRRVGRWRTGIGLVALAGAGAMFVLLAGTEAGAGAASLLLGLLLLTLVAFGLLGPWLIMGVAAAGRRRVRRSALGFLAVANMSFSHRRYASVAIPLMVGSILGGVLLGIQPVTDQRIAEEGRSHMHGSYVMTSDGGLAEAVRSAIEKIPGVAAAVGREGLLLPTSLVTAEARGLDRIEVVSGSVSDIADLRLTKGSLAEMGAETVAVSTAYAVERKVTVGDRIAIVAPGQPQPVTLRVTAIYERYAWIGDVLVDVRALTGKFPVATYSSIHVRLTPGGDPARIAADLGRAGGTPSSIKVSDQDEWRRWLRDENSRSNQPSQLLILVFVAFLVLASANNLLGSFGGRGAELDSLRHLGGTRAQIRTMLAWESVLVTGTALAVGAAVTVALLTPFSLNAGVGFPPIPASLLVTIVSGPVAVMLAALVFGVWITREVTR
ncbi:FtsX-like permease family protein [Sphaerimonospora cavernae]|uniref:FtsX-like permease family protein n=1 Tax=Sphaerimonospora cavernae TaxID=1740611 RepID=A0ABV6UB26_9ACTN